MARKKTSRARKGSRVDEMTGKTMYPVPDDETAAGEAKGDETAADEAKAGEATADEAKGDETAAGEAKGDETAAGEAKGDETAADEAKSLEEIEDDMARQSRILHIDPVLVAAAAANAAARNVCDPWIDDDCGEEELADRIYQLATFAWQYRTSNGAALFREAAARGWTGYFDASSWEEDAPAETYKLAWGLFASVGSSLPGLIHQAREAELARITRIARERLKDGSPSIGLDDWAYEENAGMNDQA